MVKEKFEPRGVLNRTGPMPLTVIHITYNTEHSICIVINVKKL
jgi:hypothetical protein